jgi:DNA gyrase inhibitor GyrI
MIVLQDLIVQETQKVNTEEGQAELPGGLYAKFKVNDTDNALVPVNEVTFNALTQVMLESTSEPTENLGA